MKLTEGDIILDYECMDNILIWTKESEQLKKQILQSQEVVEHLKEYLKVMKDEPEGYIKLSKVYHDLRRILGDE